MLLPRTQHFVLWCYKVLSIVCPNNFIRYICCAVEILPVADVVVAKGRCRVAVQRCLRSTVFCICILYSEDIKMH